MELPRAIGRYQVRGVLGSGGFATVFHAVDEALDDDVAIKVLAENWSYDPDVRARFISEARLMRTIDSDVVVRVFDIGETEGRPFFVMPLAERGTLDDRLTANEPVALEDVRRVAVRVAAALRVLHGAGIVHRDLKPANLLVRADSRPRTDGRIADDSLLLPDERLMLADFGLAKDVFAASGLTVNAGTPGYVAPEQTVPGAAVDARTDVYAASALVCRLWSGRPPAGDTETVFDDDQRAALGGASPTVLRGLRSDPGARPVDVDAWEEEILRAIDRERETRSAAVTTRTGPAAASPVSGAVQAPAEDAQVMRRRALIGGAIVLAGVAAFGSAALLGDDADAAGPVVGPSVVPVGGTGMFTAAPERLLPSNQTAVAFAWVDWNGARVSDPTFVVRPSSTGALTFTLEVTTASGEVVSHEQRIRIVDEGAVGAVVGPAEIPIGSTGVFTVDPSVIPGSTAQWTDASGTSTDAASYFVRPSSTGTIEFTVADGETEIEHLVRAVD